MTSHQFDFSYILDSKKHNLSLTPEFPIDKTKFIQKIVKQFKIPCFLIKNLEDSLDAFLRKVEALECSRTIQKLFPSIDSEMIESLSTSLTKKYTENWLYFAGSTHNGDSKNDQFKQNFDKLLKSHVDSLIQIEKDMVCEMNRLYSQIEIEFNHVTKNFYNESADAKHNDDADIAFQTSLIKEVEESWKQRIISKKSNQRSAFVNHVTNIISGNNQMKTKQRNSADIGDTPSINYMEESFTASSYPSHMVSSNIRLIASLPLDYSIRLDNKGNICFPQRVDTLLSLNTNRFNGILLFTDDFLTPSLEFPKDFLKAADRYCDFLFDNVYAQLKDRMEKMEGNMGDIIITKHSNLNQIHVAFHLLSNIDDLQLAAIPVTSSVSEAIKNVIQFCSRHNILQLTVPLFLTCSSDVDLEKYYYWCCERADAVLKIIKGALYDLSMSSVNINFAIPQTTSVDLFERLSALISEIYKQKVLVFDKNSS